MTYHILVRDRQSLVMVQYKWMKVDQVNKSIDKIWFFCMQIQSYVFRYL